MVRNPVLLVMSILAGVQVITGASNLADLLPAHVASWLILAVAAVQVTVQFWVRGQVTPLVDPRNNDGVKLRPGGDVTPPS